MKISQRLLLAFGLVLAMLAAMVAVALIESRSLHAGVVRYDARVLPAIRDIHRIMDGIASARRHETQILVVSSDADVRDLEGKLAGDRRQVADALATYAPLLEDEADATAYHRVGEASAAYWKLEDQVLGLARHRSEPAQAAAAVRLLLGESRQTFYSLQSATEAWSKHHEELSAEESRNAEHAYLVNVVTLASLGAIALVLGGAAAWWITRSIVVPIRAAVGVAEAVADGNLAITTGSKQSDEIGQLLRCLDRMTARLSELVSDVRASSETVSGAARQIAASSEDLSQRTQSQAATLEETAASMEQITAAVAQSSDHARNATELARGAHDLARDGGAVVAKAEAAMVAISESSTRIASIIGVIDEIAFQTNLLALNAAVEAARAGDAGRGFAVVASEVRGLAQRSAAAAGEIKALIGDSVGKVQVGAALVAESGSTLSKILREVQKMSELITQTATSSREQAQGIGRVNDAIVRLDSTTQQNAAAVEQSSSASREMQEQAERLAGKAAIFRVRAAEIAVAA